MAGAVVLVPLDGSESALCALPIARRIAETGKSPVRILHVTEEAGRPAETAEGLGLKPADLAGAALEVRGGDPAEAILAAASDGGAGLIVMAAHSAPVRPASAIGRTAQAVLSGAPCPVVLIDPARARDDWTLGRALATHDGSPAVSHALGPATRFVREAGGELVVLQVAQDECAQETGSIAPPVYVDQVQHSWPAWSEEFLHRLGAHCPLADVPVRLRLAHGEPAAETVRVAGEESADLIVLSWSGRWDAAHAGALRAVLRDAPCPIMVTRAHDA